MKKFTFNIQDKPYEVAINELKNGVANIDVNGKNFTVEIVREKPVVATPEPVKVDLSKHTSAGKPAVRKANADENQPLSTIKVYAASGQMVKQGDTLFTMESNGKMCNIQADKDGVIGKINLAVGEAVPQGASVELTECGGSSSVSTENAVPSPLPGTIVQILLPQGSSVKAGDVVLTMDSMKMVNNVNADKSGVIKNMLVSEGQAVYEGDPLFVIE